MNRKTLCVCMALVFAAALAGCGAQSDAAPASEAAGTAASQPADSAAASQPADSTPASQPADSAPAEGGGFMRGQGGSTVDVPDVPMGDRKNGGYIVTYSDAPWCGVWKDAETGSLMVWEAQEGIGDDSGEEQPDGSYRITARMIDGGESIYLLSADWNVLQALGADGTPTSTWVTPAPQDAPSALPAEVWGGYEAPYEDDPLTSGPYLLIDAFRIGDCLYSDLSSLREDNTRTMTISGLFEDWTQEICYGEVDGSYQFELYDDGLPGNFYTKVEN